MQEVDCVVVDIDETKEICSMRFSDIKNRGSQYARLR